VKANKGSGVVDRVSIEDFEQNLPQNLNQEINKLRKEIATLEQMIGKLTMV